MLFSVVAGNRFEHCNYLSSNEQFLDSANDAGFIFVSSEVKVILQIADMLAQTQNTSNRLSEPYLLSVGHSERLAHGGNDIFVQ